MDKLSLISRIRSIEQVTVWSIKFVVFDIMISNRLLSFYQVKLGGCKVRDGGRR